MTPFPTPHAEAVEALLASCARHLPVNATFIGHTQHDHRLPDLSEGGLGDFDADLRAVAVRLEALGPAPDPVEEIDRRLSLGHAEIQRRELASGHFQRGNPSLHVGEAVFGVMGLFLSGDRPEGDRAAAAVARMSAIPDFLARARACVRAAPAAWTERAVRECDGALAFFTEGVALLAAGFASPPPSRWAAEAERAAEAFAEHRAWLATDLAARPTEAYAAGAEALDAYLRRGHFLDRRADEIAEHAEEELSRAEARLQTGAADLGAAGPEEALERLADLHPPADGYYARYEETWSEVRALAEREDVVTWPAHPIRYVPRPPWARAAAPHLYFLFYRSPAAFGPPRVHDYLVAPLPDGDATDFLRAHHDGVIKLNHVIHHGGLGHHVQNAHARRGRSRVGRVAATDCASRIAMFCGGTMAEGWACYATDLAAELGALTRLERYAEHRSRARMAARAVVDVRLHQGTMTLDEAATFYEARAGMTPQGARGEAVKNSMFPGAALMYLVGTDAIHALRAELRRRRGDAFDLRAFHDEFLSYGSIPVTLIAQEMTAGADGAQ